MKEIRLFLRSVYLNIIGSFVRPSFYVHILNGHMVDWNHDNDNDGLRFSKQLAKLSKYCDFVNIEEAVRLIVNKVPVKRPTVAFTFDDGWRDCYTQIVPQLAKYGVNAAFFINPNFVEAGERNDTQYIDNFTRNITKSPGKYPMTWEQIRVLKNKGFIIGAHTLDHYCINDNNLDELEHQIGDCKRIIEDKLGVLCEYFAFPYGKLKDANLKSVEIACKHYKYVFSQSDHKHFFSFNGKVLNRRHFEPFWPIKHVLYFLSSKRS